MEVIFSARIFGYVSIFAFDFFPENNGSTAKCLLMGNPPLVDLALARDYEFR
jgi:hypothetical protein